MIYRRSVAIEPLETEQNPSPQVEPPSFASIESQDFYPLGQVGGKGSHSKRKRSDDEDEDMILFRRVRIKTSIFLPAKESRPGTPVFAVEEFRDSDYEENDEPVLRPHQYEDAESEKSQSPPASSPTNGSQNMALHMLGDLDGETEEQDEEEEREAWLKKQIRMRRGNGRSAKKRKWTQIIESGTDDEDLQPLAFNELGSSARRLRRKAAGERVSLIFDDPPVGQIVEANQLESGDEDG
jgi:hypothetical protein